MILHSVLCFCCGVFFSSRRRHKRCALVTGVQTCALPISAGGFPLQVPDSITNQRQLMRYFETWTPQYASGSARSYANLSIGLLGVITAKALGRSFKVVMERQLFPLLGLHDSYIHVSQETMGNYAQGYDKANLPVRVNPGVLANEAYGVKTQAKTQIP